MDSFKYSMQTTEGPNDFTQSFQKELAPLGSHDYSRVITTGLDFNMTLTILYARQIELRKWEKPEHAAQACDELLDEFKTCANQADSSQDFQKIFPLKYGEYIQ